MRDSGRSIRRAWQVFPLAPAVPAFRAAPLRDAGPHLLSPANPHHVNHRLAAVSKRGLNGGILQDVEQGPSGVVQPNRLTFKSAAIFFVVRDDMEHGGALVVHPASHSLHVM